MKIYLVLVLVIFFIFLPEYTHPSSFPPWNNVPGVLESPQTHLTVLSHDGAHSRNNAPQPLTRFSRCYFLILPAEMTISGFPAGVNINSLGFNYQYGTTLQLRDTSKYIFKILLI
jgi:hypothetical protein